MSEVPVSGFKRAMVRGRSSVRIRPSVNALRVAGFRNRFFAASASSMMRRATVWNCSAASVGATPFLRSEEHTSELQSHSDLVYRLLLEKKKQKNKEYIY